MSATTSDERAREIVAEAIGHARAIGDPALLFGDTVLACFRVLQLTTPDVLSAELAKLEAGTAREVRRRLYEFERQAKARASEPDADTDSPVEVDLAKLAAHEPQPPEFIVPDMLPQGEVTLFAADGGTGKSAIALGMAVCIALGRPFHGVPTKRRPVDYVSFEDTAEVIHWRLWRICRALDVGVADVVAAGLRVFDGTTCITPWYSRGQYGEIGPTIAFHEIAERVGGADRVVIVDGSADVFAAGEIVRAEVKAFIRLLRRLIGPNGALLLLGHVDRQSVQTGATALGFSGSTAWNNSVRCRWYMYRDTAGEDDESGDLVLEVRKSNLGKTGARMVLRFDDATGVFRRVDAPTLVDCAFQRSDDADAIVRTIRQASEIGNPIPVAMSGTRTAHAVCEAYESFPKGLRGTRGRKRFYHALEQLRAAGAIVTETVRRENRHLMEVFRVRD